MSTRKLTALALFTTVSLAVYAIECAIPPLVPIPGIKPGLANIITLILLKRYSSKEAVLVLTARILLSALLFGQAVSLFYSVCGGLVSLLIMILFNRLLKKHCLFLTGSLGGLFHNLAQLLAAMLITSSMAVLAYLPHLVIAGILTGLFTGFCAMYAAKFLPKDLHA